MTDRITYGPMRVFVPICVRSPLGFIGGPDGYEERTIEHVDDPPIIVVAGTRTWNSRVSAAGVDSIKD